MQAIDRAALAVQTGGDSELADEVLALFAGQCRAILPRLIDPSVPGTERADLAHTLKGSAAGVGAAQVRACADAAEAPLRAGAEPTGLDDLVRAVAAALAEIEPDAKSPDAES